MMQLSEISLHLIVIVSSIGVLVSGNSCVPGQHVYGENDLVDELITCSLSRLSDLDLTPRGEHVKHTASPLVDQGLSNKTTIVQAKLSGLWTAKRTSYIETGWRCDPNETSVTSIIELSGLTLDVVEKLDVPSSHRNQHKLAAHRPCKTMNLPTWMCRQTKPIYRTITTWVNRAYFNLTLSQSAGSAKPTINMLSLVFTCPETFKQKISHSPSAYHILSKHMPTINSEDQTSASSISGGSNHRERSKSGADDDTSLADESIAHPVSYMMIQDGLKPASPPYHRSVNVIMNQVTEVIKDSLRDCIELIDSDLSLLSTHNSFSSQKYRNVPNEQSINEAQGMGNECSNRFWVKSRIELGNDLAAIDSKGEESTQTTSYSKRSQYLLNYPSDPNELLNPYGYYHGDVDQFSKQ